MAKFTNVVALSLAGCFALTASSCSLAFNLGDDQCDKASDCKTRGFPATATCVNKVCVNMSSTGSTSSSGAGGALPAGWECLGNVKYPDPMGMPVKQDFAFLDALSQAQVSTLKVKLCGPLDTACANPVMPNPTLDAMGDLSVTPPLMPSGFYLDIVDGGSTSSSTSSSSSGTGGGNEMCCDSAVPPNCSTEPGPAMAYRHALAYVASSNGSPIKLPPTLKTIRAITNDGLCTLSNLLPLKEDPTRGSAVVLTPNCNDVRSPGVIVVASSADSETVPLYFQGSLPKRLSQKVYDTDAEGAAAFINLSPGPTQFTTYLWNETCAASPNTCPRIGSATVLIRAQTLTYVHVGPSP